MNSTTDTGIPEQFKRQTNAKGVTLSAGPAVVATGAKADQVVDQTTKSVETLIAPKPLSKKAQAKLDAEAKRAAKAAAPKSTPVTPTPALVVKDGAVEEIEKVKKSIVPMKFKERYKTHGGTCGDDMALELKAATTTRNADKREVLDVDALWAIAKVNEIDVTRYVNLNNGQKRMNVGNKLRGRLAAGADVVIGARQFKAEDFVPKH